MSDPLTDLPAQPLHELLGRLIHEATEHGQRPQVTLILRSGVHLGGTPVAVSTGDPRCLLLTGDGDATYIELAEVAAVQVHSAANHLALLACGAIDAPPAQPPTRLGLKRQADATRAGWEQRLGQAIALHIDWDEFPDDHLWSLALAFQQLAAALDDVLATPDGLQAIRDQVTAVHLQAAHTASLSLPERTLTMTLAPGDGPRGRYEQAELVSRIEALL